MWLTKQDVLTNGNRQQMVERVLARPGIGMRALADDLGIDYKTAAYHARVLHRTGALVLVRDGHRLVCYHPAAPRPRSTGPTGLLLPQPIEPAPPSLDPTMARNAAEVGRALAVHRSTAYAWLRRWEKEGLVARTVHGWSPRGDEAFSREPRLARAWQR